MSELTLEATTASSVCAAPAEPDALLNSTLSVADAQSAVAISILHRPLSQQRSGQELKQEVIAEGQVQDGDVIAEGQEQDCIAQGQAPWCAHKIVPPLADRNAL